MYMKESKLGLYISFGIHRSQISFGNLSIWDVQRCCAPWPSRANECHPSCEQARAGFHH